jgi:putative DNA primase/helicase
MSLGLDEITRRAAERAKSSEAPVNGSDIQKDARPSPQPARRRAIRRDDNDPRPKIRITAGDIERIVDEAEDALIKSNRGLYQRGNQIVAVGQAPALAAHGREIVTQRIFERGEHALIEDLAVSARFEKYDARSKSYVTSDPPMAIVKTLQQRIGRLKFPILTGVINAPTMRADGSILDAAGYDVETGLLFDPARVEFPPIPMRPTRAEAQKALALLEELIESFPFVAKQDRSVALSAILTACVRRSLPTSPLHAFTAPVAGSGKSKLVDVASVIATGHEASVMAQGQTEEELEKRLGSMLLAGDSLIAIDNCERPLGGEFLCQILTQSVVRTRILGESKVPEMSTGAFVAATGNNLVLVGDLTRRALLCRLDPKVERPETRVFDWEPTAVAKSNRAKYVGAALTVLRAFHVAGRPGAPPPLGSFEGWSDLVCGALLWLGNANPIESMDELRKADPRLDDITAVIAQWRLVIGDARVTVAEVIGQATEMRLNAYDGGKPEFVRPDFREALLAIAGQGGHVNSRKLGRWLGASQKRIVGGSCFETMGTRQGVSIWALRDLGVS